MLYFMLVKYRDALKKMGHVMIEHPKIEICKTYRTLTKPAQSTLNTMIDLDLLGTKPPQISHLSLEEQLANKLFVIGAQGRQRNNFDAYDAYRIYLENTIDWKLAKTIFRGIVEKSRKKPHEYITHCRHQLDTIRENKNKVKNLRDVLFDKEVLDFDAMIGTVKSVYDFKGLDIQEAYY